MLIPKDENLIVCLNKEIRVIRNVVSSADYHSNVIHSDITNVCQRSLWSWFRR
ncbi:MAG: hypothetical protein NPMRIOTA_80023 [Nitrosopumilales archaeon]|nr:MAG: hypothetical protein NPMRIOTA_80023 [Nitrosopumilales archaeon]